MVIGAGKILAPQKRDKNGIRSLWSQDEADAKLEISGQPAVVSSPTGCLARLRRCRELSSQAAELKELLRVLLETTLISPHISSNFLARKPGARSFRLLGSRGRLRRRGLHLLSGSSSIQRPLFPTQDHLSDPDTACLGLPFQGEDGVIGLLYVEKRAAFFSELEVHFLSFLSETVENWVLQFIEASSDGRKEESPKRRLPSMIGDHPSMRLVFEDIQKIAPTRATVLITGESGTGKELVARALHRHSRRQKSSFVPINCPALPADLIESELFGHSEGSFTGAVGAKPGLFAVASGGTLFLDAIASMPLSLQSRLLRALEDHHIRRLVETVERPVDVRIIAATNQALEQWIRLGKFCSDLYHRLNVCHLHLPALRDRRSDIPLLVDHFVTRMRQREGAEKRFARAAVDLLQHYPFPGNVRELKNLVESCYYLSTEDTVSSAEVSRKLRGHQDNPLVDVPSRAQSILADLRAGQASFLEIARDPFLRRDLSRQEVWQVIFDGLSACEGNYRRLIGHFHLPASDYKKFLAFLARHDCKVDFRPLRK